MWPYYCGNLQLWPTILKIVSSSWRLRIVQIVMHQNSGARLNRRCQFEIHHQLKVDRIHRSCQLCYHLNLEMVDILWIHILILSSLFGVHFLLSTLSYATQLRAHFKCLVKKSDHIGFTLFFYWVQHIHDWIPCCKPTNLRYESGTQVSTLFGQISVGGEFMWVV